jgi:hypothetical protein
MSKAGETPRMPKSGAGQCEGSQTGMRPRRGTHCLLLWYFQQSLSLVFLMVLFSRRNGRPETTLCDLAVDFEFFACYT